MPRKREKSNQTNRPEKPEAKSPAAETPKKRALILTVGLSQRGDEGILDSLIHDIRSFHPVRVVLLATAESDANAQTIVREIRGGDECCEVVRLAGPHDLRDVFQKANEAIRHLIRQGFSPGRISINYTSGTKVMSMGLVLAATYHSCETLRYIKHDVEGAGRRSLTTSPQAVFAYRELKTAVGFLKELRFLAAVEIAEGIDEELLDAEDVLALHGLRELALAYYYWSNFRYRKCLRHAARVNECAALEAYRIDSARLRQLEDIAAAVEAGRLEPPILTDIFNNAVRHCLVGDYEDATARCYRALEMLAQRTLAAEFQIDTDDLNTRQTPAKHRPSFEALRSMEDGKVKIGLRKSYELLALLEHPLGASFREHPWTKTLLERRGLAMMAHGIRPMTRGDCEAIVRWTAAIVDSAIPGFADACATLQYAWLIEDAAAILNPSDDRIAEEAEAEE